MYCFSAKLCDKSEWEEVLKKQNYHNIYIVGQTGKVIVGPSYESCIEICRLILTRLYAPVMRYLRRALIYDDILEKIANNYC